MAKKDEPGGLSDAHVGHFRVADEAPPPASYPDGPSWPAPRMSVSPKASGEKRPARPHYHGHRQRVRDRLASGGAESMPDYELVELLLFNAVPKIDVKPLAKELLADFGGFERLIFAPREELAQHPKIDRWIAHQLKLAGAIAVRLARRKIDNVTVLAGIDEVIAYLRVKMAYATHESFRVIFLNNHHHLLADEEQGRGTVNHTPAYPREVVKRALALGASGVILAHNHPSGVATPSQADVTMTQKMKDALATVDVTLYDHLIITGDSETSMARLGLLA